MRVLFSILRALIVLAVWMRIQNRFGPGIGFQAAAAMLLLAVGWRVIRAKGRFNWREIFSISVLLWGTITTIAGAACLFSSFGWFALGLAAALVAAGAAAFWKLYMAGHLECEREREEANAAMEDGDYAGAEVLFLSALEQAHNLKNRREGPVALACWDLTQLYANLQRWEDAEHYGALTLEAFETPNNPMQRLLPSVLELMQKTYACLGKWDLAEQAVSRSLELVAKVEGAESQSMAEQLHLVGRNWDEQSRYKAAADVLRRALALYDQTGADDQSLAACLQDLGIALFHLRQFEESIALLLRSVTMHERLHGRDHPFVAGPLNMLGVAYDKEGSVALAVPCFERALSIRERHLGLRSPQVGSVLVNLAEAWLKLNQLEEALQAAERSVDLLKVAGGEQLYAAMDILAQVKSALGFDRDADRLYHTAIILLEQAVGERNPEVAEYLDRHAGIVERLGRPHEAEQYRHRAEEIRSEMMPG